MLCTLLQTTARENSQVMWLHCGPAGCIHCIWAHCMLVVELCMCGHCGLAGCTHCTRAGVPHGQQLEQQPPQPQKKALALAVGLEVPAGWGVDVLLLVLRHGGMGMCVHCDLAGCTNCTRVLLPSSCCTTERPSNGGAMGRHQCSRVRRSAECAAHQ
jgi:hypothetical protein